MVVRVNYELLCTHTLLIDYTFLIQENYNLKRIELSLLELACEKS